MNQENETIQVEPTPAGKLVAGVLFLLAKHRISADFTFPDYAMFQVEAYKRKVFVKLANQNPAVYQVGTVEPDGTRVINVAHSSFTENDDVVNAVVEMLIRSYALDGIEIAAVVAGEN